MRKRKRKKININKLIGILFFFLLITLGTCFFLKSDFFYLKKIVINNNEYVEKKEINNLLNIEKNKNIFLYDVNNLENKVKSNPYISDCQIKRKIPNKLIVNITEKNIIGPLYNGKEYCYIDDKGKLLDEIEKPKNKDLVINVRYNINNKKIKFENKNDKSKLLTLYKGLKGESIINQLSSIKFDNSVIRMKGKTGINIILNKDKNIKKNIVKISKILIDLQNRNESYGTIDLTYDDYVLYVPNNN